MCAYLLTWNSDPNNWSSRDTAIKRCRKGKKFCDTWLFGNRTSVVPGARFYLMKLGSPPRGIVASGIVRQGNSSPPSFPIQFETVLDHEEQDILSWEKLGTIWDRHRWVPRASGTELPPDISQKLGELWEQFTGLRYPDELLSPESFPEGGRKTITVNAYERNPKARDACLEKFGLKCIVCECDFEKRYGSLGNGFIHVHHVKPLSEIKKSYKVTANDLRPVCANCHAMLHKETPPVTIDELKRIYKELNPKRRKK